jgi:hypothetical protein
LDVSFSRIRRGVVMSALLIAFPQIIVGVELAPLGRFQRVSFEYIFGCAPVYPPF